MRPNLARRVPVALLILGIAGVVPTGCGGTPPDGTQLDPTIPKDVAEKQNNAYKDYAKQSKRKGQPPM